MNRQTTIRCFVICLSLLLAIPADAGVTPLVPGTSLTIDCKNGNYLTKRGTTPTGSQAVSARVNLSLNSDGTILTINFQNTATSPGAVLYAFDLGLSNKFVTVNRMEATFSGFPANARWHGPTDSPEPTNGTGTATFAARETLAGRMEAFLNRQTVLPAGFFSNGQGGNITVKLTLTPDAKNKPLLIDPVAYFLVNDPNAQDKRIKVASTGVVRTN